MEAKKTAPTARDITALPGGSKLGNFWVVCKREKRCMRSPCERLLLNPVLRADYSKARGPVTAQAVTVAPVVPRAQTPVALAAAQSVRTPSSFWREQLRTGL